MQRLSPTKTYTKDVPAVAHQNQVAARGSGDSVVSLTSGASAAAQGQDSRVSPGQMFGSLKTGAANLPTEASGPSAASSTVVHGPLTSHTSPGQVFSALSVRASKPEADGSAFSAKEMGHQVL